MIQRIQSVYLLVTALLSAFLFNGGFLSFAEKSGSILKVTFTGIEAPLPVNSIYSLPLAILIILIPLISLIAIFSYKKRGTQIFLTRALILIVTGFIVVSCLDAFSLIAKYDSVLIPGFKMLVPVLQLILLILAYRGIKKDDELVKSYDRLR